MCKWEVSAMKSPGDVHLLSPPGCTNGEEAREGGGGGVYIKAVAWVLCGLMATEILTCFLKEFMTRGS